VDVKDATSAAVGPGSKYDQDDSFFDQAQERRRAIQEHVAAAKSAPKRSSTDSVTVTILKPLQNSDFRKISGKENRAYYDWFKFFKGDPQLRLISKKQVARVHRKIWKTQGKEYNNQNWYDANLIARTPGEVFVFTAFYVKLEEAFNAAEQKSEKTKKLVLEAQVTSIYSPKIYKVSASSFDLGAIQQLLQNLFEQVDEIVKNTIYKDLPAKSWLNENRKKPAKSV
jgi:hypothetical protein